MTRDKEIDISRRTSISINRGRDTSLDVDIVFLQMFRKHHVQYRSLALCRCSLMLVNDDYKFRPASPSSTIRFLILTPPLST